MTQTRSFSEEELNQYLDGEASETLREEIDAARADTSELDARLSALAMATSTFKQDCDALLDLAPSPPELPEPEPETEMAPVAKSSMGLVGYVAVAVGAAMMLGSLLIWQSQRSTDWRQAVANYQSLYVTETLTAVEFSSAEQKGMLDRIGQRLGYDFSRLPKIEGYTFTRAQELGFEGRPLAQLTYLGPGDEPIALCVIELQGGTQPGQLVREQMHGLDVFSWQDGAFAVLLVGPKDDASLSDAAKIFQTALTQSGA